LTGISAFYTLHDRILLDRIVPKDGRALPDPLIVMALEQESAGAFERAGIPVLYTGVGKINATHHLTRRLAVYEQAGKPPPRVINFGTAGSQSIPPGRFVACTSFVQRDMDATALGFDPCTTPFDSVPRELEYPSPLGRLQSVVCGTGDSFSTSGCAVRSDVVDMEAYALAKVCWLQRAEFACIKYLTDGAGLDAASAWQDNVAAAAAGFVSMYFEIHERSISIS
jgi:adenosylhomocysteine nucleosidase